MNKLIIQNNTNLNDIDTLKLIAEVVKLGKISNNNTQYCYVVGLEFGNKTYSIASFKNKKSDRFVINIVNKPF